MNAIHEAIVELKQRRDQIDQLIAGLEAVEHLFENLSAGLSQPETRIEIDPRATAITFDPVKLSVEPEVVPINRRRGRPRKEAAPEPMIELDPPEVSLNPEVLMEPEIPVRRKPGRPRTKAIEPEPNVVIPKKKCSTCKDDKPITAFAKNKNRPDGLQGQCKDCMSKYFKNGNRTKRALNKLDPDGDDLDTDVETPPKPKKAAVPEDDGLALYSKPLRCPKCMYYGRLRRSVGSDLWRCVFTGCEINATHYKIPADRDYKPSVSSLTAAPASAAVGGD